MLILSLSGNVKVFLPKTKIGKLIRNNLPIMRLLILCRVPKSFRKPHFAMSQKNTKSQPER